MRKKHPNNEFDNPKNVPSFKKRDMPSKKSIEKAAHLMKKEPPAILAKTRRKKGAKVANEQRVAIMLSKARRKDY